MNNILSIIFLILSSYALSCATAQDFCVADTSAEAPGGFKCKKPDSVTVKDFVYSGLSNPGIHSNLGNYSMNPATVAQIPGLNGLGLSMARLDLEVGGVFPIHTHPGAHEIIVVASGSFNVGFVSSANTVYSTNLKVGDVFVFPKGLLHYLMNAGDQSSAVAYVSYSSEMPGLQLLDLGLFGNELPSDILEKVSFFDDAQIKKLKAVFGGSN